MVESKICIGRTQHVRRPMVENPYPKSGFHRIANTTLKGVNSRIIFTIVKPLMCQSTSDKQKYSNLINPQTWAYFRSVAGEWHFIIHSWTTPSDHKLKKLPRNTEYAQAYSETYSLGLQVSHIDSRHSFPMCDLFYVGPDIFIPNNKPFYTNYKLNSTNEFHCFTVHFNSLCITVQQMHLCIIKH
jgi:hypothetical protein